MRLQRATLIQSVMDFWAAIEQYLVPLVEQHRADGATVVDALHYVVAEELWRIHLLLDQTHDARRNQQPYVTIYFHLRSTLPVDLDRLFSQFIVAPQIYHGELQVTSQISGFDLYLHYWHLQPSVPIIAHTSQQP